MSIEPSRTDPLDSQQYSRYALYRSHIRFVDKHVRGRAEPPHTIEFGGSNGFIRDLFGGSGYEVAPNLPEVDIHDLSDYQADGYDFVVLDEVLEHTAKPWLAIEQIRGILKPGGCLLTSSPLMIAVHKVPEDYWRFTKAGLGVLLEDFSHVETYSWGNPASVTYLMDGMMVTTREAKDAGVFDPSSVEKYAISVWAYAWK